MKKRIRKKKGWIVENAERDERERQDAAEAGENGTVDGPDVENAETGATEVCDDVESKGEDREDLAAQLATTRDQLMRLAAEFENYKRRTKNETDKLVKYAGENILRELLPTVDNLERAMGQGMDGDKDATQQLVGLLEGVGLTHKSLLATLERLGVTPIESVGQPFNPEEQDALTMSPSSAVPVNHVLEEFARGYRYKDRILRHAQVVVSSGPAAE